MRTYWKTFSRILLQINPVNLWQLLIILPTTILLWSITALYSRTDSICFERDSFWTLYSFQKCARMCASIYVMVKGDSTETSERKSNKRLLWLRILICTIKVEKFKEKASKKADTNLLLLWFKKNYEHGGLRTWFLGVSEETRILIRLRAFVRSVWTCMWVCLSVRVNSCEFVKTFEKYALSINNIVKSFLEISLSEVGWLFLRTS